MTDVWMLLLAVFAPVLTGLATMWLPRAAVTPRVLLALAGPALAFALILGNLHLATQAPAHDSSPTHATTTDTDTQSHPKTNTHPPKPTAQPSEASETPQAASHSLTHNNNTHHNPQPTATLRWLPTFNLNIAFLPDSLGGFFGLLVSGIGILIVLYARGYFGNQTPADRDNLFRFFPTLGFFTTAMLGLVLADYTLLTLLFWELTSISSFLLIGWDRTRPNTVKLAIQAFITTGLGGMFLLAGLALFGGVTDVWRWSEMPLYASTIDWADPHIIGAFCLMLVGAFAKSAQWPLHYWLPGAMAAPTPVSAFLHSATMVKAGVFLVGRLFPAFNDLGTDGNLWAAIIIPFGTVTMLYGALTAVCKHDLKQIFAYSTVSQLGLLMVMYGLGGIDAHGHPALDFDITQIANHAFYKAALFITAGAIGHVASRRLPELFGAFYKHPAICTTMLLAAWALAALPGTISFQAKEIFLYAVIHAAEVSPLIWLVLAATVLTAMCNVAIFVRLATTLLGSERFGLKADANYDHGEHHTQHEHGFAGALIWLPAVPLVAFQFVGGLATPVWNALFLPLETNINYAGFHGQIPWIPHPGLPLLISALAVVLGVVLGLSPLLRKARGDFHTRLYPAFAAGTESLGNLALRRLQTGNVGHYVAFSLVALLAGFTATALRDPAMLDVFAVELPALTESLPGLFIGGLICLSAIMIPLHESRVVRVLLLGACGFSVVAMYVLYQAPDLALTQLFFEIISVLLFVLVLRMLPKSELRPQRGKILRMGVAIAAGLALGWLTLVAAGANPTTRLGEYFVRNTYHGESLADGGFAHGGGGFNVVNVILVDFRGFDTLGEISVLALAAMGVWSMFLGRGNRFGRGKPLFSETTQQASTTPGGDA